MYKNLKRYYTSGIIIASDWAETDEGLPYGEWITIICGNRRRMKFLNIDYCDENYNKPVMVYQVNDKVRIVYEKVQGKLNEIIAIKSID